MNLVHDAHEVAGRPRFRNILEYRKPNPWFSCIGCGQLFTLADAYIAGSVDKLCVCKACSPAERLRSVDERGRVLFTGSTAPRALAKEREIALRLVARQGGEIGKICRSGAASPKADSS